MAHFIEVTLADTSRKITLNSDTITEVQAMFSHPNHAFIARISNSVPYHVKEPYEAVRDLLQGKVTKLSNAYKEL
jgi:hypothetical protein